MDEHVYAVPDLTTDDRYGLRERGEREERIVDIYVSADHLNPDPGTQQDAVQQNTAQQQHGESKKNGSRTAAVCLGLLCVILLAGIIGLGVHKNNNLLKNLDHLQSKYDSLNKDLDQIQSKYNNVTAERDELKRRLSLCEPHGFALGAGICYHFSTDAKTWEQSRQYCDKQSDLMIINSKEKQDFVNRVVGDQWVWLGLTDREREGVWTWVDGTPLTTPTYWSPDEPNNFYGEEDCVVSYKGFWYDIPCSTHFHWICERVIQ